MRPETERKAVCGLRGFRLEGSVTRQYHCALSWFRDVKHSVAVVESDVG